tara:strand:+ start:561 stop:1064 length:504 start_codon:yes stop_codon:yes gene_type:complete
MKLGKINFFFLLIFSTIVFAEDKITTIPLINLENLKPSFEKEDLEVKNFSEKKIINLKEKKISESEVKLTRVNIVALDKITAKTSRIDLLLGETKKFGLLEIKAIKCGNVESLSQQSQAAYIQVKDLSDNVKDQVFVFNGWTFSSSTTLNPLDHPVYDLWLIGCENV